MRPFLELGDEIELTNCVLWAETDTLAFLEHHLKTEMGFDFQFIKTDGELAVFAAAAWNKKFAEHRPINVKKTIILSFNSREGVDYMVNTYERHAISFDECHEVMEPTVPFAHSGPRA